MNRDQFNRTSMFNTVSAYMDQNKSLWNGTKAINDTIIELNGKITAIADKARKQQTPTTGAADDKANVRLGLEEKILEVADQLSAIADMKGDANLAAQSEFTLSGLDKLEQEDLVGAAKRVSALGTANLAALADCGITQADLTALDGLTTSFDNVKNAPRTAIAGRVGETNTLPDVISATTSLLRNRLDKLMTKFKKSAPEFFAGYRSARVIVDRGGSGGPDQPPTPAPPTPPV